MRTRMSALPGSPPSSALLEGLAEDIPLFLRFCAFQKNEALPRRVFFRGLFRGAATFADESGVEKKLSFVFTRVVLSADVHDRVAQCVVAVLRLHALLKLALGIFCGLAFFQPGLERSVQREHDAFCRGKIAVEIDGADQSFQRVFQRRVPIAAAALLLAQADPQARRDAESRGEPAEVA